MLTNNPDNDGRTVVQVGQPVTSGSLQMVKMEHIWIKGQGSLEPAMKKMVTGHLSEMSTKKPTAPLMDGKTGTGLIFHVMR